MARSIWTGSVSFGLVNVPVRVFSAIREHDVHFHQVAPDGSRIRYERVSEKSGKPVEYSDIKRGYETSKGKWVIFEPGELDRLVPATTKTIDIEDFVALDEIDPIYYERTYHLAPTGDSAARAYALLAAAMDDRQRVGIGKVVMRQKQYLAAIRPYDKGLVLSTMLFADEVVPQSDIDDVPARRPSIGTREKQMAGQIIDSLERSWDPRRYHDDYEEELRALIRAKPKGEAVEERVPEQPARVLDLMDALRASLEPGRPAAKRARPRATKKTAAKRPRARTAATKRGAASRRRSA